MRDQPLLGRRNLVNVAETLAIGRIDPDTTVRCNAPVSASDSTISGYCDVERDRQVPIGQSRAQVFEVV